MRDYAIDVDAEGETDWDVTDTILEMGREKALALEDNDDETDRLHDLPQAPKWVREWQGPFYVVVEGSIREYFGVE